MISEIDLRDYEQLPLQKLYNVRSRQYIQVPDMDNEVIFFDHIDGMYSYCVDLQNQLVNLAAWTEVIPLQRKPE